ncbi:MAG: TIGR03936 family radical SAM-associated protein [Lachnospiraceae bacterium]|nr:TIGR03936 family radical SAM-associated protein [Lachnospiraceae bacterium]
MSVSARIKFGRRGPVRYLGHLDMMRYFQRCVMKCSLEAVYSEGFHPHQLLSFAYPLGVSMETDGDYADLVMKDGADAGKVKEALNSVMHEGIYVREVRILGEGTLNAMASVAAADYELFVSAEEGLQEAASRILAEKELFTAGDGKKKPKDIRPGILELRAEGSRLFMKLLSGSALNVRPADVFEGMKTYLPEESKCTLIRRLEIYGTKDGKYVPLIEM